MQLRGEILELVKATALDRELNLVISDDPESWLPQLDAYLCDLKESQIRDGLHVFGESPPAACATTPCCPWCASPGDGRGANASLLRALAADLELGRDPLDCNWAEPWEGPRPTMLEAVSEEPWRSNGDTRERLELLALAMIRATDHPSVGPASDLVIHSLRQVVAPTLDACGPAEIGGVLAALEGRFVLPGPAARPVAGVSTPCPPGATSPWTCATCPRPPPGAWASSPPACCWSATCRITATTCASSAFPSGAPPPCAPVATTSPRPWR